VTLQINAMFLKVLQEVLSGLLVTEPNVKRGDRIRIRRTETLKRIFDRRESVEDLSRSCHA